MIVLADDEKISQELIDTKVIVNIKVQEEAQILELCWEVQCLAVTAAV